MKKHKIFRDHENIIDLSKVFYIYKENLSLTFVFDNSYQAGIKYSTQNDLDFMFEKCTEIMKGE